MSAEKLLKSWSASVPAYPGYYPYGGLPLGGSPIHGCRGLSSSDYKALHAAVVADADLLEGQAKALEQQGAKFEGVCQALTAKETALQAAEASARQKQAEAAQALERKGAELQGVRRELAAKESALQAADAGARQKQAEAAQALLQKGTELQGVRRELAAKEAALQAADASARQKQAEAAQALEQKGAELQGVRRELAAKEAALAAEASARQKQAHALERQGAELQGVRQELAATEAALKAANGELSSSRAEAARALEQKEAALQQARAEVKSLKREAAEATEKLRAGQAASALDAAKLEAQERELGQRQAELQAKAQALAQTQAALSETRAEATELHTRVADVSEKLQAGILDVRRYRGASSLDFYDAVLTIPRLEDIYIPGKGWQVRVTQKREFDFNAPREGVRVIPLGHFNSGKTWLIDQLSGAELPKGAAVHTEGISIKEAMADDLKIILLDTVGSNSPMDSLPSCADARQASNNAETVLQELRVQEDFYRQVCFELGQVILLVVGQMSHKDQMDLVRLARAIRKDRTRKDIVVVHNLRDWDMDMLLQKSEKDQMNYVERTRQMFGLSDLSLSVTIGTETAKVIRHSGLFQAEDNCREAVVYVYHYYLTDHRLPCSCNRFAIQDMKMIITRIAAGGEKSLAEEIATAANKVQSRFASFNVDEPEVVFDADSSLFRIKEPIPDGAYRMKPRDLGSYFTMSSDDPPYSITLVPCTLKKTTGRKVQMEAKARKAYHLQIELPGLCANSLKEIKEQFAREDDTRALRWEAVDGERAEQCTICFQAKLLNIPGETYGEVAEETASEIELNREVTLHENNDVGSRHHFREGARTVKVMLRTGIMDYDNSEPPVVTYVDGVLGISLLQQSRR